MPGQMLYIHALSAIQNGTGRGSGIIDLPVARETVTGWPAIYGSTIKGILRDACRDAGVAAADLKVTFGPEQGQNEDPSDHGGGVIFTDARLLCFPARSLAGSFAWLTCPMVLRRWRRDHQLANLDGLPALPQPPAAKADPPEIQLTAANVSDSPLVIGGKVYLEEFDLRAQTGQAAAVHAVAEHIAGRCFPDDDEWQKLFIARFGIVPDDIFTFLAELTTELTARIRINDERKTVETGGLWYEEAIPAEAILAGPLLPTGDGARRAGDNGAAKLLATVATGIQEPLQIGGNATVGRGLVRMRLTPTATVGADA